EKVDQEVYFVEKADKRALLVEVLRDSSMSRVLVFSRTKHGANRIAEHLTKAHVTAEAIHGNKSQNARERALAGFKTGRVRVLVATDIAARGIDVDNVTHVINFDVPNSSETYVHRIGRTGRVGRTGRAITFVTPDQRDEIGRIERDVKTTIGEWETPEERLEHAPRPRRRERERGERRERQKPAAAEANGDGAEDEKATTTKLFVNRGENSGINEEALRWALREGAVLPEEAVHDVRVLHRFSFVEVDPELAEQTVEYLDGTKLEGKEIRLEIAKS
ncbi:MAG TPA: helicase-related protein, partial [Solirubrobacterales bacterium]